MVLNGRAFFDTQLDPELSQVVVKMQIAVAHALDLRQLAKHGVRSKLAVDSAEPLKQPLQYLNVG